MIRAVVLVAVVVLASLPAAPAGAADLFTGGSFGLGFGTVDYVSIAPTIGVRPMPALDLGATLVYTYRKDGRYSPSLTTSDYGGRVFARYHVLPPVFLQAEYEILSFEYRTLDGRKERDDYDSVLGGFGLSQAIGPSTFLDLAVLYNFSYSGSDFASPYDSEWVYRLGVTFGF